MNMADLSRNTLLFAREHRRMCKSFGNSCYKCELNVKYCLLTSFTYANDDRILEIVQRWHDEQEEE